MPLDQTVHRNGVTPLFSTLVDVSVHAGDHPVISVYPKMTFEEDNEYFLEFSDPGLAETEPEATRIDYAFRVMHDDVYEDGELYWYIWTAQPRVCAMDPGSDLWFEFFYADDANARTLDPSTNVSVPPLAPPSPRSMADVAYRMLTLTQTYHAAYGAGSAKHQAVLSLAFLYLECALAECEDEEDMLEDLKDRFLAAADNENLSTAAVGVNQYLLAYALLHFAPPPLDPLSEFSTGELEHIKDSIFDDALGDAQNRQYVDLGNTGFERAGFHMLYDAVFGLADQDHIDYYRGIWADFASVMETQEDSSAYELISLSQILLFGAFAPLTPDAESWYDDTDIWGEESPFRAIVERWYERVTPLGPLMEYGDTSGLIADQSPTLMWLFVEAADRYSDARYLEAANRILTYHDRHRYSPSGIDEFMGQRGAVGVSMSYFKMLESTGTIDDQSDDDPGSVYTLRRYVDDNLEGVSGENPKLFAKSGTPFADIPESLVATEPSAHTDHYVPDKLFLRSPGGSDGLSFGFNLLQNLGHGNREVGALVFYSDQGSLLMSGAASPYYAYNGDHPKMASAPYLAYFGDEGTDEDLEIDFWKSGNFATLPIFQDGEEATVAQLVWSGGDLAGGESVVENSGDVFGYQVKQHRHLLFGKNRFLLVRDAFEAPSSDGDSVDVSIGPLWHLQDVQGETPFLDEELGDPSWLSFYFRQPRANTTHYRNVERYSLLYFVQRDGYETAAYLEKDYLTLDDITGELRSECAALLDDPGTQAGNLQEDEPECRNGAAYVAYQRWHGTLDGDDEAPERRFFHTLLLPHGPEESPAEAAARVTELAVGEDYVSLQLEFAGGETWIVVDNPNGHEICLIQLPGGGCYLDLLVTDATHLLYRSGTVGNDYVMASQANFIFTPTYVAAFGEATDIEGEIESDVFTAGDNGEAAHDGYVRGNSGNTAGELVFASETSGSAIRVGDTATTGKQLVGIVSIDTSGLPDDAEILSAELTLTRGYLEGAPFALSTDSMIRVDVKTGAFSDDEDLETSDFNAAATIADAATAPDLGTNQRIFLGTTASAAINKAGLTQFRLHFEDPTDSDAVSDRVGFYSGEATTSADRPRLTVQYQLPE